jgi:3-oxoacyl-(acyl-carrier-protein) synthase
MTFGDKTCDVHLQLQNSKHMLRCRYGGFIADVDRFDAAFFGITGAEADLLDPQQRLLLEVSWEAMHGNDGSRACAADTGVYVGIQQMEYGGLAAPYLQNIGPFSATGSSFSVAAGRISFTYGFKGPAVSIDTACSSAMIATHSAAQYLQTTGHLTALAAAVNLLLSEATTAAAQAAGMLSMIGRCKTLDATADGYVRAEACLALILTACSRDELLSHISVILSGTAVNQDGRSSSLTAPNGPSQQAVIRNALLTAKLEASHVDTLQMHGTGTALGDPIEIGAATAVLQGSGRQQPLKLAAAKSRVGHAEPVAGLVGVLHATWTLTRAESQSISHLTYINPLVAGLMDRMHHARLGSIARQGSPNAGVNVVAGTSAFAFQGTNAHAVLSKAATSAPVGCCDVLDAHSLWEKRRCWFTVRPHALVPAFTAKLDGKANFEVSFFHKSRLGYLMDHIVQSRPLLPAAAMFEAAHAVVRLLLDSNQPLVLTANSIVAPLMLPSLSAHTAPLSLSVSVHLKSGQVALNSVPQGRGATAHLRSHVNMLSEQHRSQTATFLAETKHVFRMKEKLDPTWPVAVASIALTARMEQPHQYHLHPAALDCATQASSALQAETAIATRVPAGLDAFYSPPSCDSRPTATYTCFATIQAIDPQNDSVKCAYALKRTPGSLNAPASRLSGFLLKPLLGKSSDIMASPARNTLPAPSAYIVEWQASQALGHEPARSMGVPDRPKRSISWLIGATPSVFNISSERWTDAHAPVLISLAVLQTVVVARHQPSVSLYTPLLEPGAPDSSYAYAAAAAMLKVAAREHEQQAFSHAIHDSFEGCRHQTTSLAGAQPGDVFGKVQGEGLFAYPRMLPIMSSTHDDVHVGATYGTCVISGGLGDIGKLVALWIKSSRRTHSIALLGRTGRAAVPLQLMQAGEVDSVITVAAADVAVAEDVEAAMLRAGGVDVIDFVFHASAVLADALLARQTAKSFRAVCAPKVSGAVRLHAGCCRHPTSRIMHFSSLTAQLGTPGQSNYAAANAAVDSLAQHAVNCGLPIGSVMWGPWAVGMTVHEPAILQSFQKAGVVAITATTGLRLLHGLLGVLGPAASMIGAGIAWNVLLKGHAVVPSIFGEFVEASIYNETKAPHNKPSRTAPYKIHVDADSFARASDASRNVRSNDVEDSSAFMLELVNDSIRGLIGVSVPPDQPLMQAGLDSLGKRLMKLAHMPCQPVVVSNG